MLAARTKVAQVCAHSTRSLRAPGFSISSRSLLGSRQLCENTRTSRKKLFSFTAISPKSSQLFVPSRKEVPSRRFSTAEEKPKKERPSNQNEDIIGLQTLPSPVSWLSVLILTIVGGGLLWLLYQETEKTKQSQNRSSVGGPAIGGSWTMVDQDGNPRTEHDYSGKFQLLYFGFTHCPDVCPVELQKMIEILNTLESKGLAVDLVPVFVTVDPKRDSVAQLRGYLAEFDQRFVGLTGTPEQVSKMAKSFRVYLSAGQVSEGDDDYLVDHSIFLYLMGPDNKFVEYYGVNLNSADIAKKVSAHISALKPSFTRRIRSLVGL